MKTSLLEEPPRHEYNPDINPGNESSAFSVERYTPDRKNEWDAFVSRAKSSTFLFCRDYMDYHQDRFIDHSLMVFRDGELTGLLPANMNASGTLISHEGLTYGGLVLPPAASLGVVLGCFQAILMCLHLNHIDRLIYKRIPAFYNVIPDDDVAYALFLLDARLYRRDTWTTISQMDRLPLRKHHQRLLKKAISKATVLIGKLEIRIF